MTGNNHGKGHCRSGSVLGLEERARRADILGAEETGMSSASSSSRDSLLFEQELLESFLRVAHISKAP